MDSLFVFERTFLNPKSKQQETRSIYFLSEQQILALQNYSLSKINNPMNPWITNIITPDNNSWLIHSDIKTIFPNFTFNLADILKETYFEITPPIRSGWKQPRDIAFVSNESIGYEYSGNIITSQPLNDSQKLLLDLINSYFARNTNTKYNGILINYYKNQDNSIGAHSDEESGLGPNGVISIVFGETRDFRIRNISNMQVYLDGIPTTISEENKIIYDLAAFSGCILWMGGNFQKFFTHEIPKRPSRTLGPRLSLTFRSHQK
jgi:alkylated DNA repair dioxygenase AlkB